MKPGVLSTLEDDGTGEVVPSGAERQAELADESAYVALVKDAAKVGFDENWVQIQLDKRGVVVGRVAGGKLYAPGLTVGAITGVRELFNSLNETEKTESKKRGKKDAKEITPDEHNEMLLQKQLFDQEVGLKSLTATDLLAIWGACGRGGFGIGRVDLSRLEEYKKKVSDEIAIKKNRDFAKEIGVNLEDNKVVPETDTSPAVGEVPPQDTADVDAECSEVIEHYAKLTEDEKSGEILTQPQEVHHDTGPGETGSAELGQERETTSRVDACGGAIAAPGSEINRFLYDSELPSEGERVLKELDAYITGAELLDNWSFGFEADIQEVGSKDGFRQYEKTGLYRILVNESQTGMKLATNWHSMENLAVDGMNEVRQLVTRISEVLAETPTEIVEGEVVDELPAVIPPEFELENEFGADDDGVITDPVVLFRLLGYDTSRANQFKVHDQKSAAWMVRKVRQLQNETEDIARVAASYMARNVRVMNGMMSLYGRQLLEFTVPQLRKREKSLGFVEAGGDVCIQKTGGVKCTRQWDTESFLRGQVAKDLSLIEELIERLVNPVLSKFNARVELKIKFDKRKLAKQVSDENPIPGFSTTAVREHGSVAIGINRRPWSLAKAKALVTDPLKKLKLTAEAQDDQEEEDSE